MAHHDIILPPEFSGEGQLILFTRYGDPRDSGFDHKWITDWHIREDFPWFPVRDIRIHKHFKPMLTNAFKELELLNVHGEIHTVEDCYVLRNTKGMEASNTPVLSVHSWGAGIDMNAPENPLGSQGNWSDELISVMGKHAIYCGQSWNGRKDPMHFAMVNG